MAIRYAVATGNWSSPATWDGGSTIPSSTDDVYSNNFTVTIDQNVTVNSLKKISNVSPAITAGGSFVINGAYTVNITAGIAAADNTTNSSFLLHSNAGSANVTINSNIVGGASTQRVALQVSGSGTITINGNLTAGTGVQAYAVSVVSASFPTVAVNGNVTGAAGSSSALSLGTSGRGDVTGNVTGGAAADAFAITIVPGAACTIRGDIRPGNWSTSGQNSAAISSGDACRVSGNIYCGGMVASTGIAGTFPIRGAFSCIDGEALTIHLYDDNNYPNDNSGNVVEFELDGGGGTPGRFLNVGGVATPIG